MAALAAFPCWMQQLAAARDLLRHLLLRPARQIGEGGTMPFSSERASQDALGYICQLLCAYCAG
jgi:hypothetical protein